MPAKLKSVGGGGGGGGGGEGREGSTIYISCCSNFVFYLEDH